MPNQYTPHTRNCIRCGAEYTCKPSTKRHYCSHACANKGRVIAPRTRRPVADRFWEKVNKESGLWWNDSQCWVWIAGFGSAGYGKFGVSEGSPVDSHRVAWELTYGPVPDELFVLHHCDNRACVNPAHLFLGTHLDNMRDMDAKGRRAVGDRHPARLRPDYLPRGDNHPARLRGDYLARGDKHHSHTHPEKVARGERHGWAKLTEETVRALRADHAATGSQFNVLAQKYGTSDANIRAIIHRKTWRHIE